MQFNPRRKACPIVWTQNLDYLLVMNNRQFTSLKDRRLVKRGNKILDDLFRKSVHSIRQLTKTDSEAKGCYRFLQNLRVTEQGILANMVANCRAGCAGKYVLCLQDTSEINLSSHSRRIHKDEYIGTTNAKNEQGLGFFVHPSLVVDAQTGVPYGYSDIKIWNRPLTFRSKHQRQYNNLPIEEKESYKWIEVSRNTQSALSDIVVGMVIVQDREGDIYEQFAVVPVQRTDLLIRCRSLLHNSNRQKGRFVLIIQYKKLIYMDSKINSINYIVVLFEANLYLYPCKE